MVLPAGTSVPPVPYLLVLVAGVGVVGFLLRRERPTVTETVVLALSPWMVLGASLHVLYQVDGVPSGVAPFLGTPAVYVSVAVVAGATWLLARGLSTAPEFRLAVVGAGLAVAAVAYTLVGGGVVRLAVPLGALVVGSVLGLATWRALGAVRPAAVAASGRVGLLVLVAHAVDGVSTAVAAEPALLQGFEERTPASRFILELSARLPTAELLGVGWLFVLVKLAVAGAVVVYFAAYVREEPTHANALLGLVAAVGLGPGVHNLLLFMVVAV